MESEDTNTSQSPILLRSIAPVITILVGAVIAFFISKGEVKVDEKETIKKPMIVELVKLEKKIFPMKKNEYGKLDPWRKSNISSEVQAKVIEIHPDFREGVVLQKGTTVIKLDTVLLDSENKKLSAELAVIKSEKSELQIDNKKNIKIRDFKKEKINLLSNELNRKEELHRNGKLVSKQELDQLKRGLLQEKEIFEQFNFNIDIYEKRMDKVNSRIVSVEAMRVSVSERIKKSDIRLPFTGRFQAINVELGSVVNPGQSLFTLLDDSQLEVSIPMLIGDIEKYLSLEPSAQWYKLNQNNKVVIEWENGLKETEGLIKRIAQHMKSEISHSIVISLKNTEGFKAGMFVKVLLTGKKVEAIRIPNYSVYGSNKIYIISEDKTKIIEKKIEVLYIEGLYTYINHSDLDGIFLVVTQMANPFSGLEVSVKQ